MLVPNYLDRSPIHGIGIFARDSIPEGTRVWEFTPGFDQVFSDVELATLKPLEREAILFYCYVEQGLNSLVLCCDNARHFNYADDPNCGPRDHSVQGFLSAFALRDIAAGEELTYSTAEDADAGRKLGNTEGTAA
ncbi:SET domain-containing protein [Bauldia sp.]|uniref:SET domain-containing protein n=1 Tax=Bauldia sp. TaxID=2575872 RepID=UPI0025C36966|nr:SET domain-containing protein [Bauldia sp.]